MMLKEAEYSHELPPGYTIVRRKELTAANAHIVQLEAEVAKLKARSARALYVKVMRILDEGDIQCHCEECQSNAFDSVVDEWQLDKE